MNTHPVLDALALAGVKMGLERMRAFMASMGNPHLAYPVIHVAGTNGKGSVCRMVAEMLGAQGYRVGVTTSPHLQDVNERIQVGGSLIDDADLDALIAEVAAARDAWAAAELGPVDGPPLTWFEFSIAMAFRYFAKEQVDIAVVEVGLGGRLDATNVCAPLLTSIVTIGLDHCDLLGPDHAHIAREKAGILKPGVPAVVGALSDEALTEVRAIAAARGVPLAVLGAEFDVAGSNEAFVYRDARGELRELAVRLPGDHQRHNAAVAVALVRALPAPWRVDAKAVRSGLRAARNPGRIEWLAPDLLVDGAHNPDGAKVLATWLGSLPRDRRRTLVVGGGTDKDLRALVATLAPQFDHIVATAGSHPKARSAADVAEQVQGLGVPVTEGGGLADALMGARADGGLVVVAGSLYLVGEVRGLLGVPSA